MTKRRFLNVTSDLFTRNVDLAPGERVLLLNTDDPELAQWAVDAVGPVGRVTALHSSHRVLDQLARVDRLEVSDAVYPNPDQQHDITTVLFAIPRGREQVRAYLWTAARVLNAGGRFYLAGPNEAGAKSAISDAADLFGAAPVLGYKSSGRLALATRSVDANQALSVPEEWRKTQPWQSQMRSVKRPEGTYTIITMPGVFSWDHLDEGTALLLDHLGVEADTDVLDIGCGYGMIGLAAARSDAYVTLVDDNLLAVRCADASVRMNDLDDRCVVLASDVTSQVRDRQFDLVLSNPPFHHGVEVTTDVAVRIISESMAVLRPGGRLRIVANRFLPYDRAMRDIFGNVVTITQNRHYQVLESVRD